MELEHDNHGCACGHDHCHEAPRSYDIFKDGKRNEAAEGFIHLLNTHHFLPCARFLLKSTRQPEFTSIALAPVFISDGEESVALLRSIGELLLGLEQHGYISIDYDIPLDGFDYTYFQESKAYRLFEQTVQEARGREGFLGDIAAIEFGSIALIV